VSGRARKPKVAVQDLQAGDRAPYQEPPEEVREVTDQLIASLGTNLSALLWHGSWARGEQTPESDHDMIVIVKRVDDELILKIRAIFAERPGWSTYIKSEEELRQYPVTGRLQFHYGLTPLYGEFDAPGLLPKDLVEDIRLLAVNIQHECRYRAIHGGRRIDSGLEQQFVGVRSARWMYYQAKLAVLALKARELLRGHPYPGTREQLRQRLTDDDELAIIDIIDLWPELRPKFEEDSTPLGLQIDAFARKLVSELDSGALG
jgi:hypothetical protein